MYEATLLVPSRSSTEGHRMFRISLRIPLSARGGVVREPSVRRGQPVGIEEHQRPHLPGHELVATPTEAHPASTVSCYLTVYYY